MSIKLKIMIWILDIDKDCVIVSRFTAGQLASGMVDLKQKIL